MIVAPIKLPPTFSLPFFGAASGPVPGDQSSEEREEASPHPRKLRIAVAEDNRADVLLVQEALQHHRIEADLTVCRDGEEMFRAIEAVEAGESVPPDLILLDLNLPKRSGQMVLARIRQSRVLAEIPVIIVTSSDATRDRASTAMLGASSYFRKPADYDEFLKLGELIRQTMGR